MLCNSIAKLSLGTTRPSKGGGLRHLGLGTWRPAILISRLWAAGLRHLGLGTWQSAFAMAKYEPLSASIVVVCVCCTICKATDAQFAKPQTHILQSNSNVQSTAEISCLPCSVAVTLRAIHSLIRSLEGTHALEADFLLNFRMAVLSVGGEGRRARP